MLKGLRCPQGRYFKAIKGYPNRPKTIGEHVKKRRLDLGLRQTEVAARLGIHFTTLQLWERGIGDPGIKPLPGIIGFLGYVPFDCDPTLGGRICFLRRCCGMTQEEIAAQIECNPETLWRWESNLTVSSRKHALAKNIFKKEPKRLGILNVVIGAIDFMPAT
jgi:transcriptional regulator with XRE-family HTH domain